MKKVNICLTVLPSSSVQNCKAIHAYGPKKYGLNKERPFCFVASEKNFSPHQNCTVLFSSAAYRNQLQKFWIFNQNHQVCGLKLQFWSSFEGSSKKYKKKKRKQGSILGTMKMGNQLSLFSSLGEFSFSVVSNNIRGEESDFLFITQFMAPATCNGPFLPLLHAPFWVWNASIKLVDPAGLYFMWSERYWFLFPKRF